MSINIYDKTNDTLIPIANNIPIGSIIAYGGITPPNGWLLCDGRSVSRTDYSELFSVIGTSYGSGDGSATFNLPLEYKYDDLYANSSANDCIFNWEGDVLTDGSRGRDFVITDPGYYYLQVVLWGNNVVDKTNEMWISKASDPRKQIFQAWSYDVGHNSWTQFIKLTKGTYNVMHAASGTSGGSYCTCNIYTTAHKDTNIKYLIRAK